MRKYRIRDILREMGVQIDTLTINNMFKKSIGLLANDHVLKLRAIKHKSFPRVF